MITAYLENIIKTKAKNIEEWFVDQYQDIRPCFYSSVDVRDAGYKIAPVDTNLFPAGFNNLTQDGFKRAVKQVKNYIISYYSECKNILLIPENHTRNNFYFSNVEILKNILTHAGYKVEIGLITSDENLFNEIKTNAPHLDIKEVKRQNDMLKTSSCFPDLVLLNTDLTSGIPEELKDISQPIIPNPIYGWHNRTKSKHFECYDNILNKFCKEFAIDPFLLSTTHYGCGKVDFKEQKGIECVALAVNKAIYHIKNKYNECGIIDTPYVYIKAERGTYGMGIMTAFSGEDIYDLNKKLRNKMDIIKEGIINSEVIVQEGIKTISEIKGMMAEPLIYLINGRSIDCFFRANAEKDDLSNLNSRGAQIINQYTYPVEKISIYKLIAELASLAASKEFYI